MSIETERVQYECASCGATNRIPKTRVAENPTCGACKEKIFPRQPVVATDATFAHEVSDSPIPVLVDFWAPWCGPCRTLGPVLEEVAAMRAGKIKVVKLNVDENPAVARRFGIRSIPALKIFSGTKTLHEMVGAMPKSQLLAQVDQAIR